MRRSDTAARGGRGGRAFGRRRTGGPPLWAVYLSAATLVGIFLLGLGDGAVWNLLWTAVPLSSVIALIVGIRRNRPTDGRPWWLIAVGMTFWFTAHLEWAIWYAVTGENPPVGSAIDLLFLTVYPILFIGLAGFAGKAARRDLDATLDAAVVTAGMGLVSWSLVIGPLLADERITGLKLLIEVAFPLFDQVVVFFVARLVFLFGTRNVARMLLFWGFVALLCADTAVLFLEADAGTGRKTALEAVVSAGWMAWAVLTATAALHPSMRRIAEPRVPASAGHLGRVRGTLFVVLIAICPIPFLFSVKNGTVGGPGTRWVDVLVPLAFIVGIMVLLVSRLGMVARTAERRARELDRQAGELATALREENELKRQLTHRALHDPLTGLANRTLFQDRIEQALSRRRGEGDSRLALVFIDVDGFKDVNDTHGHPVGDDLLVAIARRLRKVLREADSIARLGGDEFATLIEGIPLDRAQRIAARVIAVLAEPFVINDRRVHITVSAGLLMVDGDTLAADALRDADLALYAAKAEGKNRVGVFDRRLRAERLDHVRITAALREALDGDEFALDYQPIVDLRTRRVEGVEALLRWIPPPPEWAVPEDVITAEDAAAAEDTTTTTTVAAARWPDEPDGVLGEGLHREFDAHGRRTTEWLGDRADERVIMPADFLPLAEETGLIIPIGMWVLRQACTDALRWHEEHGIYVAVNVSARQVGAVGFVTAVLDILRETGLPPQALVLELTETILLAQGRAKVNVLFERLQELRDHGVRVALDDFGTGYSTLARWHGLPVDVIKIDQSFMRFDEDLTDQVHSFTRGVMGLCRLLHLPAVAEGIETRSQHDFLLDLDCTRGQGFLYARPMPAAAVERLLGAGTDEGGALPPRPVTERFGDTVAEIP